MHIVKRLIKEIGGYLFKGYTVLFRPFRGRNIILMYHRVTNETSNCLYDPAMYVTTETFEMHIREISKYFRIVPLQELLSTEDNRKGLCAITFDDGWRDNYEYAFPIIEKYKVPVTIFITINMIGTQNQFWFHSIWREANMAVEQKKEDEFIQSYKDQKIWLDPGHINEENICKLIGRFKGLPPNKIEEIISESYKKLGFIQEYDNSLLDWEQVQEMERNGISFGSHSLNHLILPLIEDEVKRMEIAESLHRLISKGVKANPFFCYPNGSWDNTSIDIVKSAGYQGAVSTRLGLNTSDTNPYILNRIPVHNEISNTPLLLWYRLFQCFKAYRL